MRQCFDPLKDLPYLEMSCPLYSELLRSYAVVLLVAMKVPMKKLRISLFGPIQPIRMPLSTFLCQELAEYYYTTGVD